MFIKKASLVIIILTILSEELRSCPEVDWFETVRTRLSDTHHIHSAVILQYHSTDLADVVNDKLFEKIMSSLPSVTFQLDRVIDSDTDTTFSSPLCIFFAEYSGDNVQIYRVMHLMNKSESSAKYFLIILRTSSSMSKKVEGILGHAWNQTIPNMVVIEIRVVGSSKVIVHQFNPFINKFYHKKFSPLLKLFPDFTSDMHGQELRVAAVNQPPFSIVTFDENDKAKEATGANILLMQNLGKYLNFTPIIVRKHHDDKSVVKKFNTNKFLDTLETAGLDMFAHLTSRLSNSIIAESRRSRSIMEQEMGVLMPMMYEKNKKILNNALESTALTLIIILFIWFAVILLKFDQKIWKLLSIFGLILSVPVSHKPSRSFERILFLTIVMLGFIYSNHIYASLTHLGVDSFKEIEYSTFERIDASGLPPMIRVMHFDRIFKDAVGAKLNLKKKSIKVMHNSHCPEMAAVHRNVCCVMYDHEAEFWRQMTRTKNGEYRLMFAKQTFSSDNAAFLLPSDSPYKKNIDRGIQRFIEEGLIGRWYSDFGGSSWDQKHDGRDDLVSDYGGVHTLRGQLTVIAVFGNSLAILVFIGEVLVHRYWNRCKGSFCAVLCKKN